MEQVEHLESSRHHFMFLTVLRQHTLYQMLQLSLGQSKQLQNLPVGGVHQKCSELFVKYESSCFNELLFGFLILYLFFSLNICLSRQPVYERAYHRKLLTGR